ncbi:MAG: hypothetical protein MJ237_06905 [bacterium]|nr:hypothetical protein [bacterium]
MAVRFNPIKSTVQPGIRNVIPSKFSTRSGKLIKPAILALGLMTSSCVNDYKDVDKLDFYQGVDKKELLKKGFQVDILNNVNKPAPNVYSFNVGFRTLCSLGAYNGDIYGATNIIVDKNDENHIYGKIDLNHIAHGWKRSYRKDSFGRYVPYDDRTHYYEDYGNYRFDANLVQEENSKDYEIKLKVFKNTNIEPEMINICVGDNDIQINGKKYSKEEIEQFKEILLKRTDEKITLDGKKPNHEIVRAHRALAILLGFFPTALVAIFVGSLISSKVDELRNEQQNENDE